MLTSTYDADADALYIGISAGAVARTVEVDPNDPGTMVDLDARGIVVGIEVITPARPWPLAEILGQFRFPTGAAEMLRAMYPLLGDDNGIVMFPGKTGQMLAATADAEYLAGV